MEVIHSGERLSIRFITADVVKGAGGKLIHFPHCRLFRKRPINQPRMSVSKDTEDIRRDPRHNYNFTRNLELPNGQIRKVHPILITHINEEAVV